MLQRPAHGLAFVALAAFAVAGASCHQGADEHPLASRAQTWAELRVVRRGVTVTPPGEATRPPYPRERLVDGEGVELDAGALAWLRRDGGATLLVRGPAKLVLHPKVLEMTSGSAFVDAPTSTEIGTPAGSLHLAKVRASLETSPAQTRAYVLVGEVRTSDAARAGAGETLVLKPGAAPALAPALAWEDWTGGLATTEREASPAPYGVGTVGARSAGDQGTPRFPLAIRRLDVRVTIDHDLAVTEVDELFFNPSSDVVEGVYRFRAPEGATLHRFGVDRDGVVVWGRVKEKAQAAAQYQSNVYEGSKEDPALLEWDAPGVYRARLYPIQPGEARRVVVRYAEWLGRTGDRGERRLYTYPMAAEGAEASLPTIEELSIRFDLEKAGADDVRVGMQGVREGTNVVVRAQDIVPRADLALELFDKGLAGPAAYRAPHQVAVDTLAPPDRAGALKRAKDEADYIVVRLRPKDVPVPAGGLDFAIVVDTSAATDPAALAVSRAAVRGLLAHLGAEDRVAVWAGDTGLRPILEGRAGFVAAGDREKRDVLAALAAAPRGGASDVGEMLARAATSLDPARRGAVVYIGDGVPTVGEDTIAQLRARLAKLPRPVRMFALGVGDDANLALLQGVARGGFAERIGDGNGAARAALRLLEQAERPALLGAGVELGDSVERVYPRELGALLADESLLVVGRARGKASPTSVTITTPTSALATPLQVEAIDDRGDLSQRWAEERLAQLLDEGAGRAAMVDVGMRHGIVTPFTSLYVPTRAEMTSAERLELAKRSEDAAKEARKHDEPRDAYKRAYRVTAEEHEQEEKPRAVAENRPEPARPSRRQAQQEAQEFGMIGLLNAGAGGDPNAPTAPWGRDDGAHATNQLAPDLPRLPPNAYAPRADAPAPESSTEVGAGRVGHGLGLGSGQGFGSGHGRLGGPHRSSPPRVRLGEVSVAPSHLPVEVVRRILRQNLGRFRLCYENGLRNNPNIQGRVSTAFLIDERGDTSGVGNAGSDMPDSAVVTCVQRSHAALNFPQPEIGKVRVVAQVLFDPGGGSEAPAKEEKRAAPAPNAKLAPGEVPRIGSKCDAGAFVPLADRVALWRERLQRHGKESASVALTYTKALNTCEAPTWRERVRLLALMLDALPAVKDRVALWREMVDRPWAADVLYRSIFARVGSADEMRALHAALGLRAMDAGALAKAMKGTKSKEARVSALRKLVKVWPSDFALATKLLDALEDAGDDVGSRAYGRTLRARPDADAALRTAVGELHVRLAARATDAAIGARDEAEARRAFGEIVEFAPEDPIARRRLGDLFRAHGWFDEAMRQYQTLARLTPDDPGVDLLIAASNQGLGKLEAAVKWAERGGVSGAPNDPAGAASTARAFAATWLARGRREAEDGKRGAEARAIGLRLERVLATERFRPASAAMAMARVTLTWSHPELHPTLSSNALGASRVAPEGDAMLGIAQVVVPARDGLVVEVRVDAEDLEHAARLGAKATLTILFDDGRVSVVPVAFADARATQRFVIKGAALRAM